MTTEIQQYKCPSCGHQLGQQEYLHACEKLQGKLTEQLQQQRVRFEKILQGKDKEFASKVDSIVSVRMTKEMAEERIRQAKENEAIRDQALNEANERIKQIISEKDIENRQIENQYQLRIGRLDDDNKKLRLQVEEQRKRLDSISSETRGTAGENGLLEQLKQEFKTDEFVCKKNGAAMADIIQYIAVTQTRERIGTPIAYDKKMSSRVTKSDLVKAKNYKRIHNTDYCIIVTTDIQETVPRRFTEIRDGILLVHPEALLDITRQIRDHIIQTSRFKKINDGRDSKKDRLYESFTNPEYCRDLQARLIARAKLDELQVKEEENHRTLWNKRKELLSKLNEFNVKYDNIVKDITQNENDGEFPSI